MIPLLINLKGRQVLVVGAGLVATRRIRALLKEGARVFCVSLNAEEDLQQLASNRFFWQQKKYEPSDLEEMDLVIAATDDQDMNETIKRDCEKVGLLCSRVDCHQDSDVIFPSVIRRGKLTISVCTEGASPTLTKEIVHTLSHQYDESYAEKIELLSVLRAAVLKNKSVENQALLKEMTKYSISQLRQKVDEIAGEI